MVFNEFFHDGCDKCRYEGKSGNEEPCKSCRQNYVDKWQKKPDNLNEVIDDILFEVRRMRGVGLSKNKMIEHLEKFIIHEREEIGEE